DGFDGYGGAPVRQSDLVDCRDPRPEQGPETIAKFRRDLNSADLGCILTVSGQGARHVLKSPLFGRDELDAVGAENEICAPRLHRGIEGEPPRLATRRCGFECISL